MTLDEYRGSVNNPSPLINVGQAQAIIHDGEEGRVVTIEVDEDHHIHLPVTVLFTLASRVEMMERKGIRGLNLKGIETGRIKALAPEVSTEFGDLPERDRIDERDCMPPSYEDV